MCSYKVKQGTWLRLPKRCPFNSCLLVSSADKFCKQFGPRSGLTKSQALSGSKLFDTLMVLLKEFFKKVDFEKNQQTTKIPQKIPRRQRVDPNVLRMTKTPMMGAVD